MNPKQTASCRGSTDSNQQINVPLITRTRPGCPSLFRRPLFPKHCFFLSNYTFFLQNFRQLRYCCTTKFKKECTGWGTSGARGRSLHQPRIDQIGEKLVR